MKRACILTECARGAGHRKLPFGKMMARPAAAIVWAATLWSDLPMQSPESDRARTGGKAW